MDPDHNRLAPSSPSQTQRLPPKLALIATNTLDFLALLLLAAFDVLEVTRDPLLLTALVHELDAVLLEACHSVQGELAVLGEQLRRSGHDHRGDGLVGLEEVLD